MGNFQGFIIVMIKVVIIIYKEVDDKVVVLVAYYQDLTLKDGDDDEVSMDLIAWHLAEIIVITILKGYKVVVTKKTNGAAMVPLGYLSP